MAQLVVMTVNKYEGSDPYKVVKSEERGDVIAVKEDDHVFGEKELASPNYIIIQVDGTKAEFDHLRERQPGSFELNPMLRIKTRKIDLDEMVADGDKDIESDADCKKKLNADGKIDLTKKRKAEKIVKTKAYILSKVKVKDNVPDPAIIGGDTEPGVIG